MEREKPQIIFLAGNQKSYSYIQLVLASMDYEMQSIQIASLDSFALQSNQLFIIEHESICKEQKESFITRLSNHSPPIISIGITLSESTKLTDGLYTQCIPSTKVNELFLSTFATCIEKFKVIRSLQRPLAQIIGESPVIKHLHSLIIKACQSKGSVLITGESGTGKELVAKAIGTASQKNHNPFVVVNCSAIPESLFESELFGHIKGSFTGAANERIGLFEEANGGTLFLDEIGDMPLTMQTKLLRALQEGEIRPVGSNTTRSVQVRVVAATNRDLSKAIEQKLFRDDLFFRLNVIPIHVQPLRHRKEDITYLAQHFLKVYTQEKQLPQIAPQAWNLLHNYDWPGNVRELENVMHRAVSLHDGNTIYERDILLYNSNAPKIWDSMNYPEFLEYQHEQEKKFIHHQLVKHNGSITKTASQLGINRTALHNRIKRLNINLDSVRKMRSDTKSVEPA